MGKKLRIVILIFVVLFSIVGVLLYLHIPVDLKNVKMYVSVSNYTGFNVDTDALYFGAIPGEGSSQRKFNLSNNFNADIFVHLSWDGNISQFISVSKNDFLMKNISTEVIEITANIPKDTALGEYTGNLYVIFRRVI